MSAFEKIKAGLKEAIAFEQGKGKAKTTTISIAPTDNFAPAEIKAIRLDAGLTQVLFAKYMGVSVKTVEAWESGRNHPDGAACRLLTITKTNPEFPVSSGIVVR